MDLIKLNIKICRSNTKEGKDIKSKILSSSNVRVALKGVKDALREAVEEKGDNIEGVLSPTKSRIKAKSKKDLIPIPKIEEVKNSVKKWDIVKFAEKCFYVSNC